MVESPFFFGYSYLCVCLKVESFERRHYSVELPRVWQCWGGGGALELLDAKEGFLDLLTERNEKNKVRSQVEHLLCLEEISWIQKSRMLCIKEGGR